VDQRAASKPRRRSDREPVKRPEHLAGVSLGDLAVQLGGAATGAVLEVIDARDRERARW
jgi:hypothetical protein